jgi:hypothetical protein
VKGIVDGNWRAFARMAWAMMVCGEWFKELKLMPAVA